MGWSWSGNSGGVEYLDQVVNFNPNQLTSWGQRLFNGANGIRATSVRATIYGSQTTPPTPSISRSSSPSPTPTPTGGGCTAGHVKINEWPGGFQGEVRVTAGGAPISGWRVTWTWVNGQTITQYWNANVTSSGASVAATNTSYNSTMGAGQNTTWGFLGSWNNSTNTNPTPTCTAS